MAFWLNFGVLFSVALAIIMAAVVLVLKFSKESELFEDKPFILNFCSKNIYPEKGIAYGILKSIETGKGGRKIVKFEQRDILPKDFKLIKESTVVVDQNKIVSIPKGGDWSKQKNIMMLLPSSATDFPDSLKETLFGKGLLLATEIQNAVNAEINSLKEGSERKSEILKRLGDGELSREHIMSIDEIFKDVVKLAVDAKKENKPSTYSSVLSPPGSSGGM